MPGSPHQTGVLDDKRAASAMLEMVINRIIFTIPSKKKL